MPPATFYFIVFGIIGLLVAWLPLWLERRPVSLPIIAVALGFAFFTVEPTDLSIVEYRQAGEILIEVEIIVSVMAAGLKIDRPFSFKTWKTTWRLLGSVMLLSIIGIAACAFWLLHVPIGYAVLIGAILAPTDPVLASSVQVGPPGTGEEGEVRFALTSEAGLNDGLAFPFVILGILMITQGENPQNWFGQWIVIDVIWKIGAAVAVGAGFGWGMVAVNRWLPEHLRLARSRDGLVSVALTFLVYGIALLIECWGFVAVFVSAVAIRNASQSIEYHVQLNDFAEQIERYATAIVLVLFGGVIAQGMLANITWQEFIFALLVLFVVRPLSVAISFIDGHLPRSERLAFAYFGIRGLGSLYYCAYAAIHVDEISVHIWPVVVLVVLISVVVYGVTAESIMRIFSPTPKQ